MKKIILLILLFIGAKNFAQTNGITYQAVILNPKGEQTPGVNNSNAFLVSKDICMKFEFMDEYSKLEYQEVIQTKTDGFGMVNLIIGSGSQTGGYASSFQDIVWNSINKKLIVAINTNGSCNSFTEISNQPFNSVPFAFFTKNAENVTGVVAIENGGTGAITMTGLKTNFGMEKMDNTSDLNKPISAAAQLVFSSKENVTNKSTNIATDATSDTKYPTVKSVKTYVDSQVPTTGPQGIKGDTGATGAAGTNGAAGSKGDTGAAGLTTSVNGVTQINGAITITKTDMGLGNVNNTNDTDKPISTATQTALADKELLANKSGSILLGASNVLYPTQNAVKTYVDSKVASATIDDASISALGKIQLAGDLGGTATLPTVILVGGSTASNIHTAELLANSATSTNLTNTIVSRDVSGDFSAGTISANLTGNVTGNVTGNISGTALSVTGNVGVANGGTGTSSLTGYVKGNGTAAMSASATIPATDITGAITKVNGNLPDANGLVTVSIGTVTTGVLSLRPTSGGANADMYVVSGDLDPTNDGKTYINISTGGAAPDWKEITANQAATDARYVQLAGSTMTGSLVFPAGKTITVTDAPVNTTDAANKSYVDIAVAGATISDATSVIKGKLQLAGDLAGSASSPAVATVGGSSAANIHTAELLTNAATSSNTNNAIIKRDVSGNFSAGTITANLTGNITGNAANVTAVVALINGGTGASTVANAKTNLLLDNVDNTSDANKLVSLAQQTALNAKENTDNKSTNTSLGTSNSLFPTQNAVKTYVDAQIVSGSIPDAGTSVKGKILLGGDLAGTGSTADAPLITSAAVTTGKLADNAVSTAKILDASVTDAKIATGISASKVGLGNVTNTSDASKPVSTATQNALNLKLDASKVGVSNGTASLDANGKIPTAQLPPISVTSVDIFNNEASMLGLSTAIVGSVVIRTDLSKNFILSQLPVSTLANWKELLTPAAPVQSVNGLLGSVTLTKTEIGLGNASNTADADKPVSTATQTALNAKATNADMALKAPLVSPTFTGTVYGVTAAMVGLENVNNTTDLLKPVSTATQTALDAKATNVDLALKAPLASPTFTGTVTSPIYVATKQALTAGATIIWAPASGLNASVSLSQNSTLVFSTIPPAGSSGTLVITQPASGGPYTLTLPSALTNKVLGSSSGITLSATANTQDILTFYYDGTACYWNVGLGYGLNQSSNSSNLAGGAAGAIPYQSAAGTTGFSAAGTTGQVLVSNGASAPTWLSALPIVNGGTGATTAAAALTNLAASPIAGSTSITTLGTITSGTWNGTAVAIPNGGTGATTAAAAFNALSPMTTAGDLVYGGTSGAGTRLGAGTNGQVLTLASGVPSWAAAAAAGVTGSGTAGSLPYWSTSTGLAGNPNFTWDNTTKIAKIGPGVNHVHVDAITASMSTAPVFSVIGDVSTSTEQTLLRFQRVHNQGNSNASLADFVMTGGSGNTQLDLRLSNPANNNYISAITFTNGGKVGIGNTAPTERLDVAGNIKFSGAIMPNNLPGTAGQVLTSAGAGAVPTWASPSVATSSTFVDLITAQTIAGIKTFSSDAKFNEITVGRGTGNSFYNTAVGYEALKVNTTGNVNTANGAQALRNNTTGSENTAFGVNSLYSNISGGNNTGIGSAALYYTSGHGNTAIGKDAMYINTTGSNNTAIGYNTGLSVGGGTGSGNTILGANVTGLATTLSNNIILANGTGAIKAQHDGTNWILQGTVTAPTFIGALTGNATNVSGTVSVANGGTGATTNTAAFNALSPMTTAGDILYGGTSGAGTRLGKGADGTILTLVSGVPAWTATAQATRATPGSTYNDAVGFSFLGGDWARNTGMFNDSPDSGTSPLKFRVAGSGGSSSILEIAPGKVSVLPTTASTSKTTGALVVAGGVGINGAIFANDMTLTGPLSGGNTATSTLSGFAANMNAQTGTTYTLTAADNGKIITLNNAGAITLTVPTLFAGFNCMIVQLGAGQVTLTASSTTISNRSGLTKTAGTNAIVTLIGLSSTAFISAGDML